MVSDTMSNRRRPGESPGLLVGHQQVVGNTHLPTLSGCPGLAAADGDQLSAGGDAVLRVVSDTMSNVRWFG